MEPGTKGLYAYRKCTPPEEPHAAESTSMFTSQSHGEHDLSMSVATFATHVLRNTSTDTAHNFSFSPLSLHSALTMLTASPGGLMDEDMQKALHLSGRDVGLLKDYSNTMRQVRELSNLMEIHIINQLFIDETILDRAVVCPEFLNSIRDYFSSDMTAVTFTANSKKALCHINQFFGGQTNNGIVDLNISNSNRTKDNLRLLTMLVSAACCKTYISDVHNTVKRKFYMSSSEVLDDVPTMLITGRMAHTTDENLDVSMVSIPCNDEHMHLDIFLPRRNKYTGFFDIEKTLTAEKYSALVTNGNSNTSRVYVELPKFKIKCCGNMLDVLRKIGVMLDGNSNNRWAFDSKQQLLPISALHHYSYIKVGSTSSNIRDGKVPCSPTSHRLSLRSRKSPDYAASSRDLHTFIVCHPFMFILRHKYTGVIMQMGHVTDPLCLP